MTERRIHTRIPTLSVIKTIEISQGDGKTSIPAIMCDISAGGLAMITFLPLPSSSEIVLDIGIPEINLKNVCARIVRTKEKNGTYLVALEFKNLPLKLKDKINKMANDWKKCEELLTSGEKIDCSKCSYYALCAKKVKKIHGSHQGSA